MDKYRRCIAQIPQASTLENVDVLCAKLGLDPSAIIKADGNENPYGPSAKAISALQSIPATELSRYADSNQAPLRSALSDFLQVPFGSVICGCGSDDIINIIFTAFVESSDQIVITSPTFPMYEFDSHLCDATIVDVPLLSDWRVDGVALVRAARTAKLVCLVSPNNPTGLCVDPSLIDEILDATNAIVVVDEAYIEFSEQKTMAMKAAETERLIVIRTFSKWGALAGMRVGYGVMREDVAAVLMNVKQPYNLCSTAQTAAVATLSDADTLDARAAEMMSERARMSADIEALPGISALPSCAPFILCRLENMTGEELEVRLRAKGIFTRALGHPRLVTFLRISVCRPGENDRILAELSSIFATQDTSVPVPKPVSLANTSQCHTSMTQSVLISDESRASIDIMDLHSWGRSFFGGVHGLSDADCEFLIEYAVRGEVMRDETHGLVVLLECHDRFTSYGISSTPKCIHEFGATAIYDGSTCAGPFALRTALEKSVELAKVHASAQVMVANTGWLGACGTLVHKYLAEETLVVEMWVQWHADFICAPPGRVEPRLSSNPVVLGFSTSRGPIVSDFSTAYMSVGSLEQLVATQQCVEDSCCLTCSGTSTHDPAAAWNGGSLTFLGGSKSGYKGFGMSLFSEANAVLANTACGQRSSSAHPQCFTIQMTDVSKICEKEKYLQNMEAYLAHLDSSKRVEGADPRYPGERSTAAMKECLSTGTVSVRASLVASLDSLSADHGQPPVKKGAKWECAA